MSAEIILFPGVADYTKPLEQQPVESIVSWLGKYLEMAKAGEIRVMAVAYSTADGTTRSMTMPVDTTYEQEKEIILAADTLAFTTKHNWFVRGEVVPATDDEDEPPEAA